jgi:hypothetical protein
MVSFMIEDLPGNDYEIFFRSHPVWTLLDQAKRNDQVRIQDPQNAADHRLRMFEHKLDPDRFLVVVLIFVDGLIVAILVTRLTSPFSSLADALKGTQVAFEKTRRVSLV